MRTISKRSFNISLIALLFTALSCEKDIIESDADSQSNCLYDSENYSAITDPTFSESGIIPMNLDNYWRYTDSTWDESGVLIESGEFVIQATEVGQYGDEVWWRTNFYPIEVINLQDDCLFDLQAGLDPCPNKNLSYFLFDQDSISITSTIWGDIGVVVDANKVSSISTPAGTFTDCFYYHKYGYDATTIKPDVGIVKWTSGFENNSLGGRKLTLIEYYLE